MYIKHIISIIFVTLTIAVNAQSLSVNHFGVDSKNDLSARINMVKDANGIPCALVIVSSLDEITKIEGNVVEKVDKGVEVWVYLSPGTKFIKVHTLHHPSLDINFLEYMSDGLKSNIVYQLELKSDLPPEILFGTSNASSAVEKASKDSPLLPEWWNIQEDGRYVGVSNSSYDGEIAKRSALLNAIELFALENMMNVKYHAILDVENDKENIQQRYVAQKQGFSVRILQEYYNYKGEYFVLCALENDDNTGNRFYINWAYEDENQKGSLKLQVACEFTIRRQPFKCFSQYICEWDTNKVRYTDVVNDVTLLDVDYSISECQNGFLDRKMRSLGFEQKQFLSSLPLIPDSLQIVSSYTTSQIDDIETFQLYANIDGTGKSQRRKHVFIDNNGNDIISIIKEVFPLVEITASQETNKQESEYTGLDIKYLKYSDKVVKGEAQYPSPLWEIAKNNAFVEAILSCNEIVSESRVESQATYDGESSDPTEKLHKSMQSSCIRVYPLWYMDATLRRMPNKKINKDWETTLKVIDNKVGILSPLNER